MQTSRSHMSLKDLPAGLENLHLDTRRATSTPGGYHQTDTRAPMMTPPADAPASEPHTTARDLQRKQSQESNVLVESRKDDDVFGNARSETVKPTTMDRPTTASAGATQYTSPTNKPAPRADRLREPVTPNNAQGVHPPEACVFVANLSVSRTDEQLERSVHLAFDQYGECTVKVRRDRHRHPFALVQYTRVDHASAAIDGGRDMVVDERKIRTERAQARREVVLSRIGGGPVSKDEAADLLGHYGPIADMRPTTYAEGRLHGLPEGMWVQFAYYLDFKDALKHFNASNNLFTVVEPPHLEPRTRNAPITSSSTPVGQGFRTPRSATDQKSIFVGNLPHDVTEAELLEIFSEYGEIKGCNVIRKPITGGQGYNIFGFLEFSDTTEAERAAESEADIRGHRIRVEPKEYSARRHTRLQPYRQAFQAERQPRGIAWGPSTNPYQAPVPPYGFQPVFIQQPAGGLTPFHPGYGYATTPPSSGQRRRAEITDGYMFDGSPHPASHYIPAAGPGCGVGPLLRDGGAEDYPPQQRRWR